jgi:hypothetical protein
VKGSTGLLDKTRSIRHVSTGLTGLDNISRTDRIRKSYDHICDDTGKPKSTYRIKMDQNGKQDCIGPMGLTKNTGLIEDCRDCTGPRGQT